MKFNPNDWSECDGGKIYESPKGWLRVRCGEACALYIISQVGVEALYGVGTAFDVEVAQEVTWRVYAVSGNADVRVFVYSPPFTSFVAAGETFTNIDRMVNESGNLLEVKKAIRLFEINQRAALSEIKAERAAFRAERARAAAEADDEADEEEAGEEADEGEAEA